MRSIRWVAMVWALLGLLGGVGTAHAITGLDGRWYPAYRPDVVRWAQQVLKSWNVYAGPITGRLDPTTMQLIREFQTRAGLQPSGVPTPLTRRAMRWYAPQMAAPPGLPFQGAGTLLRRVGQVRVTHATPPRRGAPQDFQRRVNVGDIVETGPDGKVMLQLDDGSTLVLGNNTRLQVGELISAPAERERSVLVQATRGVLRFAARLVADATSDVRVQAPTALAAVRATDWLMWMAPDATAVFVEDGSVAVTNVGAAPKEVVVQKGQGTDVAAGKQPTDPAPWGAQRIYDLHKAVEFP